MNIDLKRMKKILQKERTKVKVIEKRKRTSINVRNKKYERYLKYENTVLSKIFTPYEKI
ncbi:hypothetical protein KO488_06230 [Poseidonibacter lekithochrous]|uniref:hypothetical protein n=1 Tax=Poseidonibacter TaxID=2321187 RepID=UPI001C07FDCA|nr:MULTISPECIES: hypothetical protein [Poseidonibacter]MBU3014348.1 hypothetical protein [Poseidonibacter lekithochrous]MDO6827646.1 hypothetical protein [Poseidonibacter sp. 1_MG-2023]